MKRNITALFLLILFSLSCCEVKYERQEYAEMLITKIESFKRRKDRLPMIASELGLTDKIDNPAFYERKTDSTYTVWYGLSVGESKVYNSLTKKWTKQG